MSNTLEIGKGRYTGGSSQPTTVYYELKFDKPDRRSLTLRLAPPIKSEKDNGRGWFTYSATHFGYSTTSAGRDGKTYSKMMPFACIQRKNRDGLVTQECPECTAIATKEEELKQLESNLRAAGKKEEVIKAATEQIRQYLKDHNLSRKMKVLAKDESGKWGIFTMGMKMFKALEATLQDLSEKSKDALAPVGGLYIQFSVSGSKWNDLTYTAVPRMIEGKNGTFSYKTDSFTASDFEQLQKLPELKTLNRVITEDNIRALVNSYGDQNIVRQVFNLSQKVEKEESPTPVYTKEAQVSMPTATVAPSVQDDATAQVAALQAQLAALQAKQGVTTPAVTATAPKAAAKPVETQSEEEFFAQFQ